MGGLKGDHCYFLGKLTFLKHCHGVLNLTETGQCHFISDHLYTLFLIALFLCLKECFIFAKYRRILFVHGRRLNYFNFPISIAC